MRKYTISFCLLLFEQNLHLLRRCLPFHIYPWDVLFMWLKPLAFSAVMHFSNNSSIIGRRNSETVFSWVSICNTIYKHLVPSYGSGEIPVFVPPFCFPGTWVVGKHLILLINSRDVFLYWTMNPVSSLASLFYFLFWLTYFPIRSTYTRPPLNHTIY